MQRSHDNASFVTLLTPNKITHACINSYCLPWVAIKTYLVVFSGKVSSWHRIKLLFTGVPEHDKTDLCAKNWVSTITFHGIPSIWKKKHRIFYGAAAHLRLGEFSTIEWQAHFETETQTFHFERCEPCQREQKTTIVPQNLCRNTLGLP